MKTTLDLADDLLIAAKAAAVHRRTTLKALVEHALRRELVEERMRGAEEGAARVCEVDEDGLPYLPSRKGRVTSEQIYRMIEDED